MKSCRDLEPLKTPYVDGEAAPTEKSAVEAHINVCPPCRDEVNAERAARDVLVARRAELRGCAPDSLKTKCAGHAPAASAPLPSGPVASASRRKPPVYRRWMPMSLAATFLLVVAGIFGLGLTEKVQALAFQTTIDHVKCARFNGSATPADPVAEGQRWAATYGWPLRVAPSSKEQGLQLRAVRRCAVTDGRVAHLMYQWHDEPLSVYVLPSEAIGHSAEVHRMGHDAVMWSQNGRTYIVLTRAPERRGLDAVVGYVKANVY